MKKLKSNACDILGGGGEGVGLAVRHFSEQQNSHFLLYVAAALIRGLLYLMMQPFATPSFPQHDPI